MRAAFKVTHDMALLIPETANRLRESAETEKSPVQMDGMTPAEGLKHEAEKPVSEEKNTAADEPKPAFEEKSNEAEELKSADDQKAPEQNQKEPAGQAADDAVIVSAQRMQQTARRLETLSGQADMEDRLQYLKTVSQWIDHIGQNIQRMEEQTARLDKKLAELRNSQNPEEVYRKVLRPLAEWVQIWQEIARDQPENAEEITARIDEAAEVIEREGRLYGVRRYRGQGGDLFDGERMIADEDVVVTSDEACSGKIIESLGDGWEMNGQSFFDEKVRAYRYAEKDGQ